MADLTHESGLTVTVIGDEVDYYKALGWFDALEPVDEEPTDVEPTDGAPDEEPAVTDEPSEEESDGTATGESLPVPTSAADRRIRNK